MHTAYPTAGIRITVKKFVATAFVNKDAGTYTTADTLLISNANGHVSQAAGVNGPIRVDRDAVVDLFFEVVNGDGTTDVYQPVGISFFGKYGGIGMEDFPTRTITADPFKRLQLRVHDANVHGNSFEFKVVLQRERDGALGVIDPQVDNA